MAIPLEAAAAAAPTRADPMRPAPFRARRRDRETSDTFTLTLEPPAEGFRFAPGQFNMLYAFGAGEVPISISGDPARTGELVHTIRAVGSVTSALSRLKAGAAVGVRGPYGSAWPLDEARGQDVVVVAGGIGLAPLRPAIHHLLSHRGLYGRVAILYGARTPADILYAKDLAAWRGRFDAQVEVTVDRAGPEWQGNVGVVTRLVAQARFDADATRALVCGPEVMMRFAVAALAERGLPDEAIHVSMERSMKCGVGLCGHCQLGPHFVCKDGPVFRLDRVRPLLAVREV
jgi:NAD(P)H-flavin reductase